MSEKHDCCKQIWDSTKDRWHRTTHQCTRAGKFEVEGKWYCGVHNPNKDANKPRCPRPYKWSKDGICGTILRSDAPFCSSCMDSRQEVSGKLTPLFAAIARMEAANQDTTIARNVAIEYAAGWQIEMPWEAAT